jgi:hypothetical protein
MSLCKHNYSEAIENQPADETVDAEWQAFQQQQAEEMFADAAYVEEMERHFNKIGW